MLNMTGRFVPWDGGCVFLGRRSPTIVPLHAHYAIQIAFGSETGIRFRASEQEPWTAYRGVVIPSRQPHSMDSTLVELSAVLFVEPETREGRLLAERFPHGGITPLPDDLLTAEMPALFAAWRSARDDASLAAAAQQVVQSLTGGMSPYLVTDPRILRAIAYIKAHIDQSLTLEAVAAEACLSPSRFRHLFVEQTGLGLRPYILWRRFLRVWELLAGGATLSAAAHAAGFADAAHLTRTSRRMFGFPPSVMLVAEPLPSSMRDARTDARPDARPDARR